MAQHKIEELSQANQLHAEKGTFKFQVYPYIGTTPIEDVTSQDIQNMVNQLVKKGLSYSTIKKAYDNVNGCLREYRTVTRKTGLYNPCEAVVLPETKKRDDSDIVFYSAEEISKIYNEATRKWSNGEPVYYHGLAIVLLMFTGMRVGEAIALEWSTDIDFEGRTISITKNVVVVESEEGAGTKYLMLEQSSAKTYSGKRVIAMSDNMYRILKALRLQNPESKYVMGAKKGTRVNPRNLAISLRQ